MKKNVERVFLCLLTAVIVIANVSCTRKPEESVKEESAGQNVIASNVNKVEKKDDTQKNLDENSIISVISEPEGKDFLLYMEKISEPVYPQDFDIGQLQPVNTGDETVDEIFSTAKGFLLSLIKKEPAVELISTEKREFVERNLNDQMKDFELTDFRIGLINTQSKPAAADVRLMAGDLFFSGTMYFIREGNWKVYDFHPDFKKPDESKKSANEKWFPLYNMKI